MFERLIIFQSQQWFIILLALVVPTIFDNRVLGPLWMIPDQFTRHHTRVTDTHLITVKKISLNIKKSPQFNYTFRVYRGGTENQQTVNVPYYLYLSSYRCSMVKRWKRDTGNDSSLSKTDRCNLHYRSEWSDVIYIPTGGLFKLNVTFKTDRKEKEQKYPTSVLLAESPIALRANYSIICAAIFKVGDSRKVQDGIFVPEYEDCNEKRLVGKFWRQSHSSGSVNATHGFFMGSNWVTIKSIIPGPISGFKRSHLLYIENNSVKIKFFKYS